MLSNKTDISLGMALWLAHDTYDHDPDEKVISATALLKPLRSLILGSRPAAEGIMDISSVISSRLGTAVHDAIDRTWSGKNMKQLLYTLGYPAKITEAIVVNPPVGVELPNGALGVYLERRSKKDLLGYTISGKFDFVINGGVRDFKTTKTFSYIAQSNAKEYMEQGSIYRWLNPEIITSDIMHIDYLFTDWSPIQALRGGSYPPHMCMSQSFPLMSLEATEEFLKRKLLSYFKYKDSPEASLPRCTKDELWQSDPVFKYYKNPAKRTRSTKNFDNKADAAIRQVADGGLGIVLEVPGEVKRCKYCPGVNICTQKDEYLKEGLLKL